MQGVNAGNLPVEGKYKIQDIRKGFELQVSSFGLRYKIQGARCKNSLPVSRSTDRRKTRRNTKGARRKNIPQSSRRTGVSPVYLKVGARCIVPRVNERQ